MATYDSAQGQDLYASELIGMRVYSAEQDFDSFNADTVVPDDSEANWDDIGEVNEVILARDGQVKAVILGVGGFLGIGEKDVAVDMKSIKFVNEDDDPDEFFLVVKTNKDALTDAPAYERQREAAMQETETAAAQTETATQDPARPMLATPEIERDGYAVATPDQMTTEDLTGARVYGANDEDIGEVNELLLDDSGKIKEAVLDIGGFLGLGEHRIAVTMDELKIMRSEDGGDIRVYVNATKEELEAQPEYDG
ncbi:PRC-barrel domain-containing protein [Rhodophyticola sp.]|uniref:PRC-barrel domain-containing protein n=1 Tax=Rhodophyticola sp. TaxID=2680032 RepID=UPI003D29529A